MKLKKENSSQKLKGAYYTPLQLSNSILNLIDFENIHSVLEPSCGDGVFLDSLMQLGLIEKFSFIDAVEIDLNESLKVSEKQKVNQNVHVYNEDFFEYYARMINNKKHYDLILGNPPYIRYQYLTETQRELQSKILTSHGMKANKLINAWVAFLVACVQLLSERGKIAFVIPAEILQVAYAEDLRLFLTENLAKITLITFERLVFPDIEQEIIVFLGEKESQEKGIRIVELEDLNAFDSYNFQRNSFQKTRHVKEKWTKYFTTEKEIELIQTIRLDNRFVKFSDLGLINVGITTGNNSYFSLTEETCNKYNLESVTLPLIGRSSHTHGIYFTQDDWSKNKASGKRARLLNFRDSPYEKYPVEHKAYIELGESAGENEGYKCSIRDRWYIIPSVWVPDAFFLRRSNLYPKFVLNQSKAVSTDTMHRIKFNSGVNHKKILLAYYNSISFAFSEICGRSYGGGVLEILPGEMGNIILPNLLNVDESICVDLLERIDLIVRKNDDIEKALDIVDTSILVDILGIDTGWCLECRSIWKKMRRRRLGRGKQ